MDWNKLGALASMGSFLVGTAPLVRVAVGEAQFSEALKSKFVWSFFALGVFLALVSLFLPKRSNKDAKVPSVDDSLNQELSNVTNSAAIANPVQMANPVAVGKFEEHHHHYPQIAPKTERRYNLATVGKIYADGVVQDRSWFSKAVGGEWPGYVKQAYLIEISNDTHAEFDVSPIGDLIAALKVGRHGEEMTISPLCWLNNERSTQQLKPGRSATAVIAIGYLHQDWRIPVYRVHHVGGAVTRVDWDKVIPRGVTDEWLLILSSQDTGRQLKTIPLRCSWNRGDNAPTITMQPTA